MTEIVDRLSPYFLSKRQPFIRFLLQKTHPRKKCKQNESQGKGKREIQKVQLFFNETVTFSTCAVTITIDLLTAKAAKPSAIRLHKSEYQNK